MILCDMTPAKAEQALNEAGTKRVALFVVILSHHHHYIVFHVSSAIFVPGYFSFPLIFSIINILDTRPTPNSPKTRITRSSPILRTPSNSPLHYIRV